MAETTRRNEDAAVHVGSANDGNDQVTSDTVDTTSQAYIRQQLGADAPETIVREHQTVTPPADSAARSKALPPEPKADRAQIVAAVTLLFAPGQVMELRALDYQPKQGQPVTISGYFTDPERLADAAMKVADRSHGTYILLNPANPDLLARANNRARTMRKGDAATSDSDILSREWFGIDVDPKRLSGISSSDAEHDAALALTTEIANWLATQGWPKPVMAASGNGGHALYKISLPNDDASRDLIQRVLAGIAATFGTPALSVDQSVFNAARIWKLYGSPARKGDHIASRPHRLARILSVPELIEEVTREQLEAVAALVPAPAQPQAQAHPRRRAHTNRSFNLAHWLEAHRDQLDVKDPVTKSGDQVWVLRQCPFAEHAGEPACIIQRADGTIGFKCHSCEADGNAYHWSDVRALFDGQRSTTTSAFDDTGIPDEPDPTDWSGWSEETNDDQDSSDIVGDSSEFVGADGQQIRDSSGAKANDAQDSYNSYGYAEWPDPMSPAAYHGPVGEYVRKLAPHTEAAPEALLVQMLTMVGNMMGRRGHFLAEADKHHTNLFSVIVASTSGRKGTSMGHVRHFAQRLNEVYVANHIVGGLSTGEGLISAVNDDEPMVPDKVVLAYEPEFAAIFRVKGREGNTLSTVIRQAWDGLPLRVMTRQSPLKATGAHISLIGHITAEELRRVMSETDAGNGFANRILWICARRARYLPNGGQIDDATFNDEVRRVHEALVYAETVGELTRDEEANALWCERYRELSSGRPGLLGAVTGRAEAQVMRLALIYALLDCSPVIKKVHLEAAFAVWDYALASARFIFGSRLGDPLAEKIYAALKKAGTSGLTRTEITRLFKNNVNAKQITQALGALEGQSLVVKRQVEGANKRPVDRWYAIGYELYESSAQWGKNQENNGTPEATKRTNTDEVGTNSDESSGAPGRNVERVEDAWTCKMCGTVGSVQADGGCSACGLYPSRTCMLCGRATEPGAGMCVECGGRDNRVIDPTIALAAVPTTAEDICDDCDRAGDDDSDLDGSGGTNVHPVAGDNARADTAGQASRQVKDAPQDVPECPACHEPATVGDYCAEHTHTAEEVALSGEDTPTSEPATEIKSCRDGQRPHYVFHVDGGRYTCLACGGIWSPDTLPVGSLSYEASAPFHIARWTDNTWMPSRLSEANIVDGVPEPDPAEDDHDC